MKVVILCGGKGTRLREETEYLPKPMVDIGGYPILYHIMKIYSHYGYNDFILCLGYKGNKIKEYFRNYFWNTCDATISLKKDACVKFHEEHSEVNWNITLADTGENSMTAFRIQHIKKYIPKGEDFMITYGDGVGDINIGALVHNHKSSNKTCTITAVHPLGRFGYLKFGADGNIFSFEEKPQIESSYINGGFMVCKYDVFKYLTNDPNIMFEKGPIQRIVDDKEINSYKHDGFWQPMDTYQEMLYLNKLWHSDQAPWKKW